MSAIYLSAAATRDSAADAVLDVDGARSLGLVRERVDFLLAV